MSENHEYNEVWMKYLEMVQAIVARLSAQSASFKNYCITLVTAIIGFGITATNVNIVALAALPIVAFGYLDARYLRLERGFRTLFDHIRGEDWTTRPSFDLDLKKAQFERHPFLKAIVTWTILGFYGPLLIGVVTVFYLQNGKP
jgi:hypothetical protein